MLRLRQIFNFLFRQQTLTCGFVFFLKGFIGSFSLFNKHAVSCLRFHALLQIYCYTTRQKLIYFGTYFPSLLQSKTLSQYTSRQFCAFRGPEGNTTTYSSRCLYTDLFFFEQTKRSLVTNTFPPYLSKSSPRKTLEIHKMLKNKTVTAFVSFTKAKDHILFPLFVRPS